METETNPVEVEDSPVEGTETEAQEVEQQAEEFDDDGNPIEPVEEDEEVELDDLKLKVPKDQAQKVREALLRQADYTRKTQELAEQRKVIDAERQNLQQATNEELGAAAQAVSIGQQLDAYNRVDWDAWEAEDPFEAQRGWRQFQQLKDAHGRAIGQLNHLRTQRVSAAQQEAARRIEQTASALAKEIPDWSPAVEAQVADFGMKAFGFTADEMADMKVDPRIAKAFHRLHTLEAQAKKAGKAQSIAQKQQVQVAETVSARSAPLSGVNDKLPIDEWMRREAARVARKNKRA